jgi:hypothetical protein
MDEKTMVSDTLAGINSELGRYGEMIPQTENTQLKQVLKQFRNQCEQSRRRSTRSPGANSTMYRPHRRRAKRWNM